MYNQNKIRMCGGELLFILHRQRHPSQWNMYLASPPLVFQNKINLAERERDHLLKDR
jgi:hypothetical protein